MSCGVIFNVVVYDGLWCLIEKLFTKCINIVWLNIIRIVLTIMIIGWLVGDGNKEFVNNVI